MEKEKIAQNAKVLKFAGIGIGIAFFLLAVLALFYKNEDDSVKRDMLFFALFGLSGLSTIVLSYAASSVLALVPEIGKEKDEDEEELD